MYRYKNTTRKKVLKRKKGRENKEKSFVEIKSLLIGALVGGLLTFVLNRIDKCWDFRNEQQKALTLLEIEVNRIDTFLTGLVSSKKYFPDIGLNQALPILDLAVELKQFVYYNEILESNVYKLDKSLENANKCREIAYAFREDRLNPEFGIK